MELRFNEERAAKVEAFFDRRLHHTKGRWAGVRFQLQDWQRQGIIRPLFGLERYSEDAGRWVRLYRKAYIELPKKSGKSELGAGIAAYGLYADGEGSPEVYSLAYVKEQAGIVFNVVADMVGMDPALNKRSQVNRSRLAHHGVIFVPKTRGIYKVMAPDAASTDGINPSMVILDELHRQPNRELYDLMDSSFDAREEPLYIILTTAGVDDPTHVAKELHDYAYKVATGVLEDPYLFVYLRFATVEETDGDGWRNEDLWRRVNPALTSFNPGAIDEYRRKAKEAATSPAMIVSFKRLRLDVWLPKSASSQDKLVAIETWDAGAGITPTDEQLAGRECYGGLDMAATTDLAAFVLLFPNAPGTCPEPMCRDSLEKCFHIRARFWIPATMTGEQSKPWAKSLKETLRGWVDEGLLTATDGSIIDDRDVQGGIEAAASAFNLVGLSKDPWGAKQLGVLLTDAGMEVHDQPQSITHLAEPTAEFIRLATAGRLHHGGNKVLRWMVSNAVGITDGSGNQRADRKKSANKIDGVAATINALAESMREQEGGFWVMTMAPS